MGECLGVSSQLARNDFEIVELMCRRLYYRTWNEIVPRDGEALRRVGAMLRFFGGVARVLHSSGWVPHTTDVVQEHMYSSHFPADAETRFGIKAMWTLVNRVGRATDGVQLVVEPTSTTTRFYDCYHGTEIKRGPRPPPSPMPPSPEGYTLFSHQNSYSGHGGIDIDTVPVYVATMEQCAKRCEQDATCECVTFQPSKKGFNCWKRSACVVYQFEPSDDFSVIVNVNRTAMPLPPEPSTGALSLSLPVEAEGFGCVVEAEVAAGSSEVHHELSAFLNAMANMTKIPLSAYRKEWTYLPQVRWITCSAPTFRMPSKYLSALSADHDGCEQDCASLGTTRRIYFSPQGERLPFCLQWYRD